MSSHHPPFPIWKRRTSIPNDLLNLQGSHMVLRVSVYAIISRNAQNTDGRNPAPVDMENLLLFTGFHLVEHFFHQQYELSQTLIKSK